MSISTRTAIPCIRIGVQIAVSSLLRRLVILMLLILVQEIERQAQIAPIFLHADEFPQALRIVQKVQNVAYFVLEGGFSSTHLVSLPLLFLSFCLLCVDSLLPPLLSLVSFGFLFQELASR